MQILKIYGDRACYLGYGESEDNCEGEYGWTEYEYGDIRVVVVDADTNKVIKEMSYKDTKVTDSEEVIEWAAGEPWVSWQKDFYSEHEICDDEIDTDKIEFSKVHFKLPDGSIADILGVSYDEEMLEVSEGGCGAQELWIDGEYQGVL